MVCLAIFRSFSVFVVFAVGASLVCRCEEVSTLLFYSAIFPQPVSKIIILALQKVGKMVENFHVTTTRLLLMLTFYITIVQLKNRNEH